MDVTLLVDLLSRKNVYKCYNEYMESQWYSLNDLKNIQLIKFRRLIEHCYLNVPYYRKVLDLKGMIPSDFKTIDAIAELPIVTKEIIKANYSAFVPENIKQIKGVKRGQTGGTTGSILIKQKCANARSNSWGAYKRFENWMGYEPGDRALILMGGHVIHDHSYKSLRDDLITKAQNYVRNRISINPYNTDSTTTNKIVSTIMNSNIVLIRSYSQYLYNLCLIIRNRGLSCHVPIVTTTAEPLMPEHRILFKDVLGSETFDQYGCGEIGGVSFECSKHQGMHITEEHVIVEQNSSLDLILTDLDNYAMPFIRYHNGDQAVIRNGLCGCGREHRLIEKILGRTCDYVIGKNGEFLHWAYFWHLIFDSGIARKRNLMKFQITQESTDKLIFKYVSSHLQRKEERLLLDNIQSRLGEISVEFIHCEEIPNSQSGKYRPVINKLIS